MPVRPGGLGVRIVDLHRDHVMSCPWRTPRSACVRSAEGRRPPDTFGSTGSPGVSVVIERRRIARRRGRGARAARQPARSRLRSPGCGRRDGLAAQSPRLAPTRECSISRRSGSADDFGTAGVARRLVDETQSKSRANRSIDRHRDAFHCPLPRRRPPLHRLRREATSHAQAAERRCRADLPSCRSATLRTMARPGRCPQRPALAGCRLAGGRSSRARGLVRLGDAGPGVVDDEGCGAPVERYPRRTREPGGCSAPRCRRVAHPARRGAVRSPSTLYRIVGVELPSSGAAQTVRRCQPPGAPVHRKARSSVLTDRRVPARCAPA